MTERQQRWVRVGLAYLTVSFLTVGLWATFAGRSFYDDFPGVGRHWVAGDGPYNAHLVSDAGVGFLVVGAVLALAALWLDRRLIQAALVAATAHSLFHLLFHLRHPSDVLGSLDAALSNGALAFGVLLGVVLLVFVTRSPAPAAAVAADKV